MTREPRGKADPLEHEIELALNPGAFIPETRRSVQPAIGERCL
jgi:hypothetical protein